VTDERKPSGGGGEEAPDADRLEDDWNRALDVAGEAVSASGRSRVLRPDEVSSESEHIRAERKWLRGFRPTLRRLFPRRRRSEQPPTSP
jgi:hypothetical protein